MLELRDVRLGAGDFAVDADWALDPGQKVGVIGPSGAGKSTLLDAIAGFRPPQRGRVIWKGQDVTGTPPQDRPVAMLFQDGNLFPHLTVARNLALALRPDGRRLAPAQTARLDQALHRVGLNGMADRRPAELSGGQQARAALARVLLQARPVLLLDEPFGALGPALKSDMLALVQEVATDLGALVLMVSHDPDDARRFARQVIWIDGGRAEAPVATERLFAHPPAALRAYLGGLA